jgi:hypothetical protein
MPRWSDKEDTELRALVQKNTVNFQNTNPHYLFEVTQTYFPDFAGEGQTGRNTAVQRLRKKFRLLADEFDRNGRRWIGECSDMCLFFYCFLLDVTYIKPSHVSYFLDIDDEVAEEDDEAEEEGLYEQVLQTGEEVDDVEWETIQSSDIEEMPKEKASSPTPRTPGKTPPKKPSKESPGVASIQKGIGTMGLSAAATSLGSASKYALHNFTIGTCVRRLPRLFSRMGRARFLSTTLFTQLSLKTFASKCQMMACLSSFSQRSPRRF